MEAIRTHFDRAQFAGSPLPKALQDLYGGDLNFPTTSEGRPYVIGNFASTIDGVVSYKVSGYSGGSTISGSDQADRFIMGLLRASVDAVMIGSHTVHEVSPKHLWIPEFVYPEAKELYTHYRTKILHKPVHPLVVIVSGSGKLELDRTIFRTPEVQTLIITTVAGRNLLAMAGAERLSSLQISTIDDAGAGIDPAAMLQLLFSKFGVRTLLHEGGPTLFAKFLERALVDELFVTLAPQIAGRLPRTNRPGIVEGVEFLPTTAPWFQLVSIKQKAEHLYLRYCAQRAPGA